MIPNPGSDAAIAEGCTCPVLDNEHGTGIIINGRYVFWVNGDCPVHITIPSAAAASVELADDNLIEAQPQVNPDR